MQQIVRLSTGTSLTTLPTVLAQTSAREVVLVFPEDTQATAPTRGALEALWAASVAAEQHVTIVGGTALLRAFAVDAGFAAATQLEDLTPAEREPVEPPAPIGQDVPRLAVLPTSAAPARTESGLLDWVESPPDYVVDLLLHDGTYVGPYGSEPHPVVTPTAREQEQAGAAALLVNAEHHEDGVTARIRDTSGVDTTVPFLGWLAASTMEDMGEGQRP